MNQLFKRTQYLFISCALFLSVLSLQAQEILLDNILTAHEVKDLPSTVQITGTVVRTGKPENFRIVATGEEQLRLEYGGDRKDAVVMTAKRVFHDTGSKITFDAVP